MRIVTAGSEVLPIGRCGENNAVRVDFPVADWIEAYGVGTFQLLVKRNGDVAPYPVVIEANEEHVFWDVTAADVKYPGTGRCELDYFVGDVLAKSAVWITTVTQSLAGESGEVPEPYEGWVDQVLTAAVSAKSSADRAAEMEQEAEEVLRQTKEALSPLTTRVEDLEEWAETVPGAIADAVSPVAGRVSTLETWAEGVPETLSTLETTLRGETSAVAARVEDLERHTEEEVDRKIADFETRITRLENHAVLDSGANV